MPVSLRRAAVQEEFVYNKINIWPAMMAVTTHDMMGLKMKEVKPETPKDRKPESGVKEFPVVSKSKAGRAKLDRSLTSTSTRDKPQDGQLLISEKQDSIGFQQPLCKAQDGLTLDLQTTDSDLFLPGAGASSKNDFMPAGEGPQSREGENNTKKDSEGESFKDISALPFFRKMVARVQGQNATVCTLYFT